MAAAGARRYWLIWAAVIPIALWAIVRVFGLERGFPLVPLMAYTPYVAVVSLFVAGVALALRNWAATGVAALAATCLLVVVLPRLVGSPDAAAPGAADVNVLSVNIHHGTASPGALMNLIERRDAELVSIQELTPSFARKLRAAGIEEVLPYAVISVRRGASGGGIYSSLPLRRMSGPTPVAFRMPRARVELPGSRSLRVVAVHPYPPNPNSVDLWRGGLRSLPPAEAGPSPWVLPGDFNATLDHAELRDLLDSGYRDAGEVLGEGLMPTWPSGRRLLPPVTIDHILADHRIAILDYAVEELPGSDHRTLYARLAVPGARELSR